MNEGFTKLVIFAAGAVIGSAVTWKFAKTKYERIAQEEIDSVKEVFSRREVKPEPVVAAEEEHAAKTTYISTITRNGYATTSYFENIEKGGSTMTNKPYVITPEEFGELADYQTISLTYYADGVLTDDYDEVIDDTEEVVGENFEDHFGEYEDDSVFVRNDARKTDYEILLDNRKYATRSVD